jgi:hypothetical protein
VSESAPAERFAPCAEGGGNCPGLSPTPAERFLQQSLGSNNGDVRLPSVLLALAVLLAVLFRTLRRSATRRRRDASDGAGAEDDA